MKGGHPTELKAVPDIASSFVRATARFSFGLSVPLPAPGSDDAQAVVLSALRQRLSELSAVIATIDGALVSEESISGVASVGGGGGGGGGKGGKTKGKGAAGGAAAMGPVEVQLYSRGGGCLCAGGRGGGEGGGGSVTLRGDRVVVLSGHIDAVGMVMITESTAAAARAIKQDIAQTFSI